MFGYYLRMVAVFLLLGVAFATAAGEQPGAAGTAAAGVRFEKPILLTSAGQSVDIKLAGVLLQRLKVPFDAKPIATAADLVGYKSLVVVPGYSSKGLGSAGVSRDDELKRVEGLLAAAAKAKIPVLTLHLGGNARRGVQSDDFNAMVVNASSMAIVVAQGNEDGFFTKICQEEKIPLEVVKIIADAMKPLEAAMAPAGEAAAKP
jgi:hypothetical protein